MVTVVIIAGGLVVCIAAANTFLMQGPQLSDKIYVLSKSLKEADPTSLSDEFRQAYHQYSWTSIMTEARNKDEIHFYVGHSNTAGTGNLQANLAADTIQIGGRPCFCSAPAASEPKNKVFAKASVLRISDMANCNNYINLILTNWNFPHVRHLRLDQLTIQRVEFEALVVFIGKHNQTLHSVEIDDSYLCPSPYCDVGKINYPNHDFRMKITRRRRL